MGIKVRYKITRTHTPTCPMVLKSHAFLLFSGKEKIPLKFNNWEKILWSYYNNYFLFNLLRGDIFHPNYSPFSSNLPP